MHFLLIFKSREHCFVCMYIICQCIIYLRIVLYIFSNFVTLRIIGVLSNYQQFNIHFETANWVFVDTLVICFSCRNTCTRISIDASNLWRFRIWFRNFCDILMNMCCFLFSKQIMGNRPNYMRFIYSEDCCSNCVRNTVSSISLISKLFKRHLCYSFPSYLLSPLSM